MTNKDSECFLSEEEGCLNKVEFIVAYFKIKVKL